MSGGEQKGEGWIIAASLAITLPIILAVVAVLVGFYALIASAIWRGIVWLWS